MKKIVCSFLILIFAICLTNGIYAYSNNDFSIDLPDTFKEESENSFRKADGTNVNVKITGGKEAREVNFTEKELKYLEEEIQKSFETYKENLKAEIKKERGNSVSDEQIDEVIKNVKWNIETKEITTVTKNKYKCYHFVSNITTGDSGYYTDQYSIATDNKFYTLTVSVQEKSKLQDQEIKNIVDSFTIANYKAPEGSKKTPFMQRTIVAVVVLIVCAIIGGINRKRMKGA